MNLLHLFLVVAVVSVTGLLVLHWSHQSAATTESGHMRGIVDVKKLLQLVHAQNQTIYALETHLQSKHSDLQEMSRKNQKLVEVSNLVTHLSTVVAKTTPLTPTESTNCARNVSSGYTEIRTAAEAECENRYGMELVEAWHAGRQVWCEGGDGPEAARLICYPYHQQHKRLDGRGPDLFCEAFNFVVDFSKVLGEYGEKKPSLGSQYLSFDTGSLTGNCKPTPFYRANMFMPHHSLQMRSFKAGVAAPADAQVEDTPTYLLARDEDCENSFHSTADFMNMFLVSRVTGIDPSAQQVLLLDRHPDGPYHELISKAFSPSHPVLRHKHYRQRSVLFRRLIFHLESPAGLIFPKVSRPDPLRCYDTSLFTAYRRFVLAAFNLLDVPPPPLPTITLSLRHRTPQKNVGRVLANEEAVKAVLRKGNLVRLHVEDTARLSYGEQLKLARSTNILVGVHGAGLMFIMFAAEEAILIEIHPSYRQDRHFRHAARMTGKIYMPIRSLVRESCVGTSDSVTAPIEEFERTLDGAVRIARNFDDGLSECGLVCPYPILALDGRLDSHYLPTEHKTGPVNTNFPCG